VRYRVFVSICIPVARYLVVFVFTLTWLNVIQTSHIERMISGSCLLDLYYYDHPW
jgi:hypothetical protein